jgi:glycosyltransferase involved in cell wall biosynthesis
MLDSVEHIVPKPATETRLKVAVLIPCFNEEVAITRVVAGFRHVLPDAVIFVYDNNSTDGTTAVARAAGAVVRSEQLQGKGNVVRRMFSDIDADVYVLVDGDATYDPESSREMVNRLINEQLDMVVGCRSSGKPDSAYRRGHQLGNVVLTRAVARLFGKRFTDILSGYRVFSKRFVKSFPALAKGFETETELTIHALELGMPIAEVATPYAPRPEGSTSKLRTYKDGLRILRTIVRVYRNERPMAFFGSAGTLLFLLSVGLAWPLVVTYLETGLVPRLPTAVLATGTMVLAFLSLACGLILDTVTQGRREARRLAYLAFEPPHASEDEHQGRPRTSQRAQ